MSESYAARLVHFRVRSADPAAPLRVMSSSRLLPGSRRQVHVEGAIVYLRELEPALREMPRIYEFLGHFQSDAAAAALARALEDDLEGEATLEIGRQEVPIEAMAICEALLSAEPRLS